MNILAVPVSKSAHHDRRAKRGDSGNERAQNIQCRVRHVNSSVVEQARISTTDKSGIHSNHSRRRMQAITWELNLRTMHCIDKSSPSVTRCAAIAHTRTHTHTHTCTGSAWLRSSQPMQICVHMKNVDDRQKPQSHRTCVASASANACTFHRQSHGYRIASTIVKNWEPCDHTCTTLL